jgi:hypothetical protein
VNEPLVAEHGCVSSPTTNAHRRSLLTLLIGVCCVGFLIADVATPSLFEEPFPAMLVLGIVTAQLTVICVWGTLVRGTFWIRLPWTLLLLVLSWCAFALGIRIENAGEPRINSILAAGVIWTIGFVTSFVPLKIAAMCFRWQIVQKSGGDRNTDHGSSYAIRDIMIGTLLLAVTMGIARAMLPSGEINLTTVYHVSGLNHLENSIAFAIFGIVSLLVKLPCIWISLGEEAEKIKSRIGLWVVYCFVLAIIEICLLIAVMGDLGPESTELFSGIIISHQLMGAIMLGVCLALRGIGYRLQRSLKSVPEDESNAVTLVSEPGSV